MGARWGLAAPAEEATTPLDGFLAESDTIAAALVSCDGTVLEANRALDLLLGPTLCLHQVVVPAHGAVVTALLAEAGPSWHSVQAGLVRRDGELVDCRVWALLQAHGVLVLAEPLRTPGEKLNSLLLELNDDLLGARRELAAKNRRLRELDELKNMFLASATHDLKTPLTSILGYAEILGWEGLSPEAGRMALSIQTSAHRVLRMINDLLDAAQIMTGELKLERSRGDLTSVVRCAVEAVQPAARARQITFSVHGPESVAAHFDERRVLQILDNLLSNAVKYSHHGGQVDVTCEPRGPGASVAVRDTGIGIPVGEQEQLFSRYFRASTALEHGIGGTGLGLANARSFAEAHGGSLACVSEPGVGSTFTLALAQGPVDS